MRASFGEITRNEREHSFETVLSVQFVLTEETNSTARSSSVATDLQKGKIILQRSIGRLELITWMGRCRKSIVQPSWYTIITSRSRGQDILMHVEQNCYIVWPKQFHDLADYIQIGSIVFLRFRFDTSPHHARRGDQCTWSIEKKSIYPSRTKLTPSCARLATLDWSSNSGGYHGGPFCTKFTPW